MPRASDAQPAAPATGGASGIDTSLLATRLNSTAIHLLRRLAREDARLGLSSARLSALSVLVFGGPRTPGKLAATEGVSAPSMTRLVAAMEAEGLVERSPSSEDGRSVVVRATPRGEGILLRGRDQRVAALAGLLSQLSDEDLAAIDSAVALLDAAMQPRPPVSDQ